MVVLSERLKLIADKIPKDSRVADIGSDHALLPVYLAEQKIIKYAIAGEVNPGPLEAAKEQVKQAGLQHMIDVRSGNGLAVINNNETDVITIAGMGGGLITQILSEGYSKLDHVKQLVLQPNVGEELVRIWLYKHDWFLIDEDILTEDNKIYEVLNAVKMEEASKLNEELYSIHKLAAAAPNCVHLFSKERLFRMGPRLLSEPTDVFFLKWEREIEKLQKICKRLSLSNLETSKAKLKRFQQDIAELKEVLACLQKDKP
jgi:tRNA (adenine22-N1)-methyltransferase